MTTNNGDMPASPFQQSDHDGDGRLEEYVNHLGLSKREHFAAMALPAAIYDYQGHDNDMDSSDWEKIAVNSVGIADALLAALSQQESGNE